MGQILINVISAVLSAIVIGWFGLNQSRSVSLPVRRIGWFWKALVLMGGFFFYYGLLVFGANLMVDGIEAKKTLIGLSMSVLGASGWAIGRLVIFFKRD